MNRLLTIAAILTLVLPAITRAEDSFEKQLAAIIPGLSAEKEADRAQPQKDLEKIEMSVTAPDKDAARAEYCKAVAKALEADLPVPTKLWLLRSLERAGRFESVAVEVKLSNDRDETVRDAAIRALANNSSVESGVILSRMIVQAKEPATRAALINAIGYKKIPDAEKLFAKDTTHPDESVRNAARAALAKIGHRADAGAMAQAASLIDMGRAAQAGDIPKIIAAFDSPARQVRQAAGQAAALHKSPEMVRALSEKLKAVAVAEKPALLSALAQHGDKAAVPALLSELKSDDAFTAIAACKALTKLADPSSFQPLFDLARNGKDNVQRAAREALDLIPGVEFDIALTAALKDANNGNKVEALQHLAARLATSAAPAVVALLAEGDNAVRSDAVKTLGAIGTANELGAVLAILKAAQADIERDQAAKSALEIARRISGDARADAAIAALKDSPESAHAALFNILGQLGGSKSLDTVKEALKSPSKTTQDGAVRALSNWIDAAPLADVLNIAKNTDNEVHRVLALRGDFRLVGLPGPRPPQESAALFFEGLKAAKKADDKKMALAGLADINSIDAFRKCSELINDLEVLEEACAATVKSAKFFLKSNGPEVSAALQTVIEKSKNAATKKQAAEAKNKAVK